MGLNSDELWDWLGRSQTQATVSLLVAGGPVGRWSGWFLGPCCPRTMLWPVLLRHLFVIVVHLLWPGIQLLACQGAQFASPGLLPGFPLQHLPSFSWRQTSPLQGSAWLPQASPGAASPQPAPCAP